MAMTTLPPWRAAIVLSVMVAVPLALFALPGSASAIEEPSPLARRFLLTGRSLRTSPRFPPEKVKRGDSCDAATNNICPGVSVRNGTQLLQCCKTHCRDVLGDRNNCGRCGNRCGFGQLCCGGACTAVAYDENNCGKCGTTCTDEQKCVYGMCGYA
ncbi:hypothetical protein Taro_048493 [Colocasia esculenta]|uniref:Uncharacterized protein n=1 Tax=Colocasia esculenta TaxID=4460 RepID=A0A843X8A2_COLES|nr:hypothetical protein [Colocasia esculenta]